MKSLLTFAVLQIPQEAEHMTNLIYVSRHRSDLQLSHRETQDVGIFQWYVLCCQLWLDVDTKIPTIPLADFHWLEFSE